MKAVRLSITGRVQGVGYRWWAVAAGRKLGLAGWVHNEPDGSVSAHVEGDESAVGLMIEACRTGPAGAQVRSVSVDTAAPEGRSEFNRR